MSMHSSTQEFDSSVSRGTICTGSPASLNLQPYSVLLNSSRPSLVRFFLSIAVTSASALMESSPASIILTASWYVMPFDTFTILLWKSQLSTFAFLSSSIMQVNAQRSTPWCKLHTPLESFSGSMGTAVHGRYCV